MNLPWRFALCAAAAVLMLHTATAQTPDATSGALFGYALGDTYPMSDETRIATRSPARSGLITLIADAPVKPDDIDQVLLVTTPVTNTIVVIGVQQGFQDETSARAFARKYLDLLAVKYPGYEVELEVMDRRGRLRFSDDYELVMSLLERYEGALVNAPWVVEMVYQARLGSPAAELLAERIDADTAAMPPPEDNRGL